MAESLCESTQSLAMTVVVMVMVMTGTGACRNNSTSQNNERNSSKKQGTQFHGGTPSQSATLQNGLSVHAAYRLIPRPHHLFLLIFCDVPTLIPHTAGNHSISTRTSSPSTRSGNTSTRSCAGYSANPVFRLNAHECHGQTTASPSIHPCPSGPCRCGQMLSSADNTPFTFARHTCTPSTSASITRPTGGASANPHNLTHCATKSSTISILLRASHTQKRLAASAQC
jgi:hypothetical protein